MIYCIHCQRKSQFVSPWCRSCYRNLVPRARTQFRISYSEAGERFIKEFKGGSNWRIQNQALRIFSKQLRQNLICGKNTWICAMPTTSNRFIPINAGLELAAASLAKQYNHYHYRDLIQKNKRRKQSQLGAQARMAASLFLQLNQNASALLVKSKPTVVLLDDVYTTGTSLFQATTLLCAAGAKEVIPLVLARRPMISHL